MIKAVNMRMPLCCQVVVAISMPTSKAGFAPNVFQRGFVEFVHTREATKHPDTRQRQKILCRNFPAVAV
jgi:hypothetical protein